MKPRDLFRRLPLTLKMVLFTLLIGLAVGSGATIYIDRVVGIMFEDHLQGLLEQQSQEDRLRFDRYIKSFHQVAELTVSREVFRDYVKAREWLSVDRKCVLYRRKSPPWFISRSAQRSLAVPRHIVLLDSRRRWHEAYHQTDSLPPADILQPTALLLDKSLGQTHIASIGGGPWMITAEKYEEGGGEVYLLLATPIDDRLLLATQTDFPKRLVGLVSGRGNILMTSNNPELLPPGTPLTELNEDFIVTGREFHDYGGAEMMIRVSSFMPNSEVREMSSAFVKRQKHVGIAITAVFVASFTLFMLWISRRIRFLTDQVEEFSIDALGGKGRRLPAGDRLNMLAERFLLLKDEVVDSHEKIRLETRELTARKLELERNERMLTMLRAVTDALGVGVMILRGKRLVPVNSLMQSYRSQFGGLEELDVLQGERIEKTLTDREGKERIFQLSSPIAFESNKVLIVHEITEQKKSEAEKERLQEDLTQAQKLESVGRLAGGIAHDFNNILTAINGYAELILCEMAPDDPLREKISIILESGSRAADLTGQLLAFSRRQPISPVAMNLKAVLDNLEKILPRLIGEDILVTLSGDENLWNICADTTQMEQVIINLAVNARDAMPSGGRLNIRTSNNTIGAGEGSDTVIMEPGSYVSLTVSDTGEGMSGKVLPHIFEPFFTTKETGKGTGLGLSMVYGIVKQNRGYIFVESTPEDGTKFTIYLPRFSGMGKASPFEGDFVPGGSETILLAEDEKDVRRFVERVLSDLGYRIIEAANGEEGQRILRQYRGGIDLIVTDVVMPKAGGEELARTAQRISPETKILFMTGYAGSDRLPSGRNGSTNILQKPLTLKTLAREVRKVLDSPS